MVNEKNFGQLGISFQTNLIKTIIEDKKFAEIILHVLNPKFFDNQAYRFIVQNLKEYYETYETLPSYDALKQKIVSENSSDTTSKLNIDTITNIQNIEINPGDIVFTKDKALNFCKQQVLKKAIKEIEEINNKGEFEEYHKIEQIIRKAMQVGVDGDEAEDVFDNIDSALREDFRDPIPTGVKGIDNLLKGGLGRGELGVILAPTGTGKTTLLSLFTNSAFNYDYNVVQIFFEDNLENIKRKHFTIWSGIEPDLQFENKDKVKQLVFEAKSKSKGNIKLLKLPSSAITISVIKNKLRKLIADGLRIDLLVIDYVDCISPEHTNYNEEWKGEGNIMRELESMTSEFNIAIWTATQGNRESISSEVVTTNQMGGSIKKAQVGHIIISIAKTLEQKEHNLATVTLLKSRIGDDGVIFNNCHFDNKLLVIDLERQNTLLGHKEEKEDEKRQRIQKALKYKETITNQNKPEDEEQPKN